MIKTFRAHRSWVQYKSLVAPNIVGTPFAAEAYKPPKEQVNFSAFPAHNEISKPHKFKYSNIFLTQSKITFPKLHKFKQQKWPDRVQLANRSLWIFVGCPVMRTKTRQEELKISTQLSGLASHRGARGWQEYSMDLTRWPSPSQKWVVKPFVKVWTLSFSTTLRLWQLFNKMRKKICILSHWKKVKKVMRMKFQAERIFVLNRITNNVTYQFLPLLPLVNQLTLRIDGLYLVRLSCNY